MSGPTTAVTEDDTATGTITDSQGGTDDDTWSRAGDSGSDHSKGGEQDGGTATLTLHRTGTYGAGGAYTAGPNTGSYQLDDSGSDSYSDGWVDDDSNLSGTGESAHTVTNGESFTDHEVATLGSDGKWRLTDFSYHWGYDDSDTSESTWDGADGGHSESDHSDHATGHLDETGSGRTITFDRGGADTVTDHAEGSGGAGAVVVVAAAQSAVAGDGSGGGGSSSSSWHSDGSSAASWAEHGSHDLDTGATVIDSGQYDSGSTYTAHSEYSSSGDGYSSSGSSDSSSHTNSHAHGATGAGGGFVVSSHTAHTDSHAHSVADWSGPDSGGHDDSTSDSHADESGSGAAYTVSSGWSYSHNWSYWGPDGSDSGSDSGSGSETHTSTTPEFGWPGGAGWLYVPGFLGGGGGENGPVGGSGEYGYEGVGYGQFGVPGGGRGELPQTDLLYWDGQGGEAENLLFQPGAGGGPEFVNAGLDDLPGGRLLNEGPWLNGGGGGGGAGGGGAGGGAAGGAGGGGGGAAGQGSSGLGFWQGVGIFGGEVLQGVGDNLRGAGKMAVELGQIARDLGNGTISAGSQVTDSLFGTGLYSFDLHSQLALGYDTTLKTQGADAARRYVLDAEDAVLSLGMIPLNRAYESGNWQQYRETSGGMGLMVLGPKGLGMTGRGLRAAGEEMMLRPPEPFVLEHGKGTILPRATVEGFADTLRGLPSRQRSSVVARLRGPNGEFLGRSQKGIAPLDHHPVVAEALKKIPADPLAPGQWGRCAEVDAVNQALRAYEAKTGTKITTIEQAKEVLKDFTVQTAEVRGLGGGSSVHGLPKAPCPVCNPFLDIFDILYK